jgi:hypothetical protein
VYADVEPREAHGRGEHEEHGSERGQRDGEHDGRRKARRRMAGGEGRGRRRRHEHVDSGQRLLRAGAVRGELQGGCGQIGKQYHGRYGKRDARPPSPRGYDNAERDPQQAVGSRVRDADQDWIQPVDAMLDDPPLDAFVQLDQGDVTVVVTVTVSRVAATGTTVRVWVVAPSGV